MRWLYKTLLRLRSLFTRDRVEQELNDELRFHLQELIEENLARGMKPEDARYLAQRELGGVEQIKEECRDMRRTNTIENFLSDLRYGLRQLRRSPGFTAVAIITLALGIGANTAIFSLIDAVMLRALPVREPQHLVLLNWVSKGRTYLIRNYDGSSYIDKKGVSTGTSFSYPLFEAIRTRQDIFSDVMGFATSGQPFNLNIGGQPGLAKGQYVSGDYFSTLGVGAALGRTIVPSDDAAAAAPVAVISYAYWTRRFGRDLSVVGKAIKVNGVPFTLAGVAAPEFFGLQAGRPIDAWVPLQTLPQVDPSWVRYLPKGETIFSVRTEWWVLMMGRLKPGVTARQANAALDVVLQQEAARVEPPPPANRSPDMTLQPPTVDLEAASSGLDELRREFSQPLFVLMCLVGLVLLVACANVANLLLARAESRQKEIAVRLALGAGRRRLVSQLLTESALLAVLGGACGIVLAYWASGVLLAFMSSGGDQIQLSVSPDLRVLAFTAVVSALTGVLFGLAPAFRGTRLDLTPALQGGGRVTGTAPRAGGTRFGLGKALVVMQAAMSLLLLIGSGLFVRTLRNLEKEDIGFDRRNLLLFTVDSSRSGYHGERLAGVYQEMQRRIEAIPGVRSATMSRHLPINDGYGGEGVTLEGYTPKPGEAKDGVLGIYVHFVAPRFFETLRVPLLLGRTIGDADTQGAPRVGVVNRAFARKYFAGTNPIGRRFRFHEAEETSDMAIVGVVGNTIYSDLREEPPPTIYVPYAQHLEMLDWMNFEVRTAGDPTSWVGAVRQAVQGVDRNAPLDGVVTQTGQIDQATFQERLFARLVSFFGLLALTLACVGLYGMMSYAVARRTNEIGIRMALGAEKVNILRLVMWEALALTVLGIAMGIPVALAGLRLIASMLYGVKPVDPLTLVAGALLMLGTAALAGYLSARRAARVDPMVALRYE